MNCLSEKMWNYILGGLKTPYSVEYTDEDVLTDLHFGRVR